MRILVTGGAGFIGSAFIRLLLSEPSEDSVANLDALTYAGNLENLTSVADDPRYRFHFGRYLHRHGDLAAASEQYRAVLRLDSSWAGAAKLPARS